MNGAAQEGKAKASPRSSNTVQANKAPENIPGFYFVTARARQSCAIVKKRGRPIKYAALNT